MTCGNKLSEHAEEVNVTSLDACHFCGRDIMWGLTVRHVKAPFDPDTRRNHWITCPARSEAREAFTRQPLAHGPSVQEPLL